MLFELDSHVHAEVWVDDMGFSSGYNGAARSVFQAPRPGPSEPAPERWDVFPLPLASEAAGVGDRRTGQTVVKQWSSSGQTFSKAA
jgi:hypothetical protein